MSSRIPEETAISHLPEPDEILRLVCPGDALVIHKLRWVLVDDKVEEVKLADDRRLTLRREGEPIVGHL